MGQIAEQTQDSAFKDEDFYSRKARRNQQDLDKFVGLLRRLAALTGIGVLWRWLHG